MMKLTARKRKLRRSGMCDYVRVGNLLIPLVLMDQETLYEYEDMMDVLDTVLLSERA